MYIREARRMIGAYVMTQANCEGKTIVEDAIGMAAYTMDSHNCHESYSKMVWSKMKAMFRSVDSLLIRYLTVH